MGLRSWLNRWAERIIHAEIDRKRAEADALRAEAEARGEPLTMTDAQYEDLKRKAEAAGPEGMERLKRMCKLAGRE